LVSSAERIVEYLLVGILRREDSRVPALLIVVAEHGEDREYLLLG
jgi:hypothetical protein